MDEHTRAAAIDAALPDGWAAKANHRGQVEVGPEADDRWAFTVGPCEACGAQRVEVMGNYTGDLCAEVALAGDPEAAAAQIVALYDAQVAKQDRDPYEANTDALREALAAVGSDLKVELWHTGGGCMALHVTPATPIAGAGRDPYLMITDEDDADIRTDGPFTVGAYNGDGEWLAEVCGMGCTHPMNPWHTTCETWREVARVCAHMGQMAFTHLNTATEDF